MWQRWVGASLPTMEADTHIGSAQNLQMRTMLSLRIAFNKLHSSRQCVAFLNLSNEWVLSGFMEILNGFNMENMDLK